jgi:hypothetical protein
MMARVVEDDRPKVLERFQRFLSGATAFSFEYRFVDRNDRIRRLVLVGQSEEAGGDVKRLSGYVVDITDAVRAGATQAVSASIQHRATIEQAKGALMVSLGVPEEAAFDLLRTCSNRTNLKLAHVAEHIVEALGAPSFLREDPVRGMLDIVVGVGGESSATSVPLR